jgi:hypothetical protein
MDVEVPGHVTSLGLSPTVRRPIPRTVRAGAADACRQVNRPGFQLTIDAILAAVQDAGLRIDEIDRRHLPVESGVLSVTPLMMAPCLRAVPDPRQ